MWELITIKYDKEAKSICVVLIYIFMFNQFQAVSGTLMLLKFKFKNEKNRWLVTDEINRLKFKTSGDNKTFKVNLCNIHL